MKKTGKTIYMAYGSNLNLEQMAIRCPTAKVLGGTILEGYELLFRGRNGSAVATVEKKEYGKVPVLLWELEPSDEAALDRYEGFPSFYRKEYHEVYFKDQPVEVMVYIMNDGYPINTPSRRYYETILQGYITAGFDTKVLNRAVKAAIKAT